MVADTVRIGPGTFNEDDLIYSSAMATNTVNVIGSGTGLTTLTMTDTADGGGNRVLNFQALAPSSVSDLRVLIPAANDPGAADDGLFLGMGVAASDVLVEGGTNNLRGAHMGGTTTLDDAVINLPIAASGNAVQQNNGSPTITDSTLTARTGVTHSGVGATTTVDRSTINAGMIGMTADSGTIVLRNSVIDLGANASSTGIRAFNGNQSVSPITATVEGSTIVGGGANSIGVHARGDSAAGAAGDPDDMVNDGETGAATVKNTVISGPATAVLVDADRGEVATLTTEYSNYTAPAVEDDDISNANATGNATLTETNKTTHAVPGFVNPAAGNYHLLATSPLIDIGDPNAPMGTDIDGDPRGLDGTLPCVPMAMGNRDIGADEYNCVPPETVITGGPSGLISNALPNFSFTSEPGAGFQCRFDSQPFAACSGAGTHMPGSPLSNGPHTFEVQAIDLNANLDPTPASRSFSIDTAAPDSTAAGKRKIKTRKKRIRVTITLGSTETGVSFSCSVDGGPFVPCSNPFLTPKLRRGAHEVQVKSTDTGGNTDQTPAEFEFKIVKKKPAR